MRTDLTPLSRWIDEQYKSYPDISPRERKEEVAETLEVGVATIYRWLKAGNVYIEDTGIDMSGEGGPVFIWKMEKKVEA